MLGRINFSMVMVAVVIDKSSNNSIPKAAI